MSESSPEKKYIPIGRVGAPHGIHGWLKIISYTEPPENIFTYSPWILLRRGKYEAAEISGTRVLGDKLIAQFAKYNVPETARIFTGAEIVMMQNQLPKLPEGEYYQSDLEGLTVIDQDGNHLGVVSEIMETGSHDILVVKGTKRILIPFVLNNFITEVNLQNKIIRVNWDDNFS
jgi:16S rRNA processing protein RimM